MNTPDILELLIDKIREFGAITSITNTSGTTYLIETPETKSLTVGDYVKISGNDYKITALTTDVSFTVESSISIVGLLWQAKAPYFFYGDAIFISNQLSKIQDYQLKYPIIVLFETSPADVDDNDLSNIDRILTLDMCFLNEADYENWDSESYYDYVIDKLQPLVNDFVAQCKLSNLVDVKTRHRETVHTKWNLIKLDTGQNVFNAKLSGIEVNIDLTIFKSLACDPQTYIDACDQLYNSITTGQLNGCLLPRYDFTNQTTLNSLTTQQKTDLVTALADITQFTCIQLKALLTQSQKDCILADYNCSELATKLTPAQKLCLIDSYDFTDPTVWGQLSTQTKIDIIANYDCSFLATYLTDGQKNCLISTFDFSNPLIYAELTAQQKIDILSQFDCTVLSNLTTSQLILCALPLYDFSNAGVISGLSAQQISDIEVNICPAPPSIIADFLIDINPANAYFTDVTFTENCTGNPLTPDTFIWTWLEDGIHKSYIGSIMTTKINALGSIVMTLTAINSVSGASGQKSVTVTANAYLPVTPHVWLDAMQGITLNGSNVSKWTDTINGYEFENTTASEQPLFVPNYRNGKSTLYFDGSLLNRLICPSLGINNNDLTIIIVQKAILSASAIHYIFRYGGTIYNAITYYNYYHRWRWLRTNPTTIILTNFTDEVEDQMQILTFDKKVGTNVRSYKNKVRTYTDTTAAANAAIDDGECVIGAGDSVIVTSLYTGFISEIMIYNSQLSDVDRNLIFDYLMEKHKIS